MNNTVKIIVLPTESSAIMNHDGAGGVGCKIYNKKAKVFPPMTCLYMSRVLKTNGYEVDFIDGNILGFSKKDVLASIVEPTTTYVLFGSLPTIESDLEILLEFDKDITVIYVNSVAEMFLDEIKESNVKCVISGDAEKSILAAVKLGEQYYYNNFLDKSEINLLPYPDWDLINIDNYSSYTLLSSRGCSLACPHCPYYRFQRDYFISRDVDNVIDEIKHLHDLYKPDYFLFRDPCFSFDMQRAYELIEKMISLPFNITWGCETRIDYLSEELIGKMKVAGCHHIRMGIESADGNILRKAGRLSNYDNENLYFEQARNVVSWCKDSDIYSVQFYMVGFPDDSADTIGEIKRLVQWLDPDVALVNYLVPYPGTTYREELEKSGLIDAKINYSDYGSKNIPVSATNNMTCDGLLAAKNDLENWLIQRNRQFYPIR